MLIIFKSFRNGVLELKFSLKSWQAFCLDDLFKKGSFKIAFTKEIDVESGARVLKHRTLVIKGNSKESVQRDGCRPESQPFKGLLVNRCINQSFNFINGCIKAEEYFVHSLTRSSVIST